MLLSPALLRSTWNSFKVVRLGGTLWVEQNTVRIFSFFPSLVFFSFVCSCVFCMCVHGCMWGPEADVRCCHFKVCSLLTIHKAVGTHPVLWSQVASPKKTQTYWVSSQSPSSLPMVPITLLSVSVGYRFFGPCILKSPCNVWLASLTEHDALGNPSKQHASILDSLGLLDVAVGGRGHTDWEVASEAKGKARILICMKHRCVNQEHGFSFQSECSTQAQKGRALHSKKACSLTTRRQRWIQWL